MNQQAAAEWTEREEARMAAVEKAAQAAKAERQACNADVFPGDSFTAKTDGSFREDQGEGPAVLTPRQMKAKMREAGLHPDFFTAKKDGTFEARDVYFYRMGRTAEGFGKQVEAAAERAGLVCIILSTEDCFRPWPRDSYFLVRFLLGAAAAAARGG